MLLFNSSFVGGVGGFIGGKLDIYNTSASGDVTALGSYVGGLAGELVHTDDESTSTVHDIYATGNISVTTGGNYIGGLAGNLSNYSDGGEFEVNRIYATGKVTILPDVSAYSVGGLIGLASGVHVTDAYATGDVTGGGQASIGGFVGFLAYDATLTNIYATGAVQGGSGTGGLAGSQWGVIQNAFSVASVSGTVEGQAAGVTGKAYACGSGDECDTGADLTNVYYSQTSTNQSQCYNGLIYDSGTGDYVSTDLATCHAQNDPSYYYHKANQPLASWDFDSVWDEHTTGYPTFILGDRTSTPTSTVDIKTTARRVTLASEGLDTDTTPTTIVLNDFDDYFGTGKQLDLKVGDIIYFDINGERHSVTVKEIGDTYVVVVIASDPITARLVIGDTQQYDVTNDALNDIETHIDDIKNGVASATFRQLTHASSVVPAPKVNTQIAKRASWWWWLVIAILAVSALLILALTKRRKRNS